MKIITFLNHKGGVGKTTMAVTVACGLASKGLRVALVDADGQGSATIALGKKKKPSFYDLIVRDAMYKQILDVIPHERYMKAGKAIPSSVAPMRINGDVAYEAQPLEGFLWLIAGNAETLNIDPMANATSVRNRLHDLRDDVDVVIIDTSPTPSKLHAGIYLATDYILYPTEVEYLAYDGLLESIRYFASAQKYRLDYGIAQMSVMGIIPNKYRPSTAQHQANLETLRGKFGDAVWEPVTLGIAWSDATMERVPVYNYTNGKAGEDAWGIINRVYQFLVNEKELA
jgi:chromosome partitioning protein